jgi:hypothetical protein
MGMGMGRKERASDTRLPGITCRSLSQVRQPYPLPRVGWRPPYLPPCRRLLFPDNRNLYSNQLFYQVARASRVRVAAANFTTTDLTAALVIYRHVLISVDEADHAVKWAAYTPARRGRQAPVEDGPG